MASKNKICKNSFKKQYEWNGINLGLKIVQVK